MLTSRFSMRSSRVGEARVVVPRRPGLPPLSCSQDLRTQAGSNLGMRGPAGAAIGRDPLRLSGAGLSHAPQRRVLPGSAMQTGAWCCGWISVMRSHEPGFYSSGADEMHAGPFDRTSW